MFRSIIVVIISITISGCVAYSPARYGGYGNYGGYGYSAPQVAMYGGGGGWRHEGREHGGWGHEGRQHGGGWGREGWDRR